MEINKRKKRSRIYKLSDNEFIKLVQDSTSLTDILRKLGLTTTGNSNVAVKQRIKSLNIDTEHFKKVNQPKIYELKDYFKKGRKVANQKLIELMLINDIREYKCENCGCAGKWMGTNITLQLHHIDGDNLNNDIENLQILCPNCHSITDNFGAKNTKEFDKTKLIKYELNCIMCNSEFLSVKKEDKYCSFICKCSYKKEALNCLNKSEVYSKVCLKCNTNFSERKLNVKFCSNKCYLEHKTTVLDMTNEELKELLNSNTRKFVADKLGITESSLYRYIKRNSILD